MVSVRHSDPRFNRVSWWVRMAYQAAPTCACRQPTTYRGEIRSKKPSSKPGRGYVTTLQKILNQESQAVFTCEVVWMIATRPPPVDLLH
jgi:hypothetical protein